MSTRRAISLAGTLVENLATAEAVYVAPDEVLIFTLQEIASREDIETLQMVLQENWPNHKAMLLAGGMSLQVVKLGG